MKRFFLILLVLVSGPSLRLWAQGTMTVPRIEFDDTKQKEELNLVNTEKDTVVYSISFVQYKLGEDGSFVIIDKSETGSVSADPYLKIFPRKVILAPGESQIVIVQRDRNKYLPAGEYHTCLYFKADKKTESNPLAVASTEITQSVYVPVVIHSVSTALSTEGPLNVTSKTKDLSSIPK